MRVAVVDDDERDRKQLLNFIKRFQTENQVEIRADSFSGSLDFLESFRASYDIIFLDIEMPGMDGLETAHEIRRTDDIENRNI